MCVRLHREANLKLRFVDCPAISIAFSACTQQTTTTRLTYLHERIYCADVLNERAIQITMKASNNYKWICHKAGRLIDGTGWEQTLSNRFSLPMSCRRQVAFQFPQSRWDGRNKGSNFRSRFIIPNKQRVRIINVKVCFIYYVTFLCSFDCFPN